MKNPIKYLKHLAKDPITTISEADARKKEIMPLFFASLGIIVISVVIQAVAELGFLSIFSTIGLVGVGFCGLLFLVINKAKQKFTVLTCNKCNTMAEIKTLDDFNKYISYTVLKDSAIFTGYSGNNQPTNGIYSLVKFSGSSSAVVSVELTCPHCGEIKHLTYNAEPFKCHAEARNVSAFEFNTVKLTLKNAVSTAVNDYNNPNKRGQIPYSFHSSKNPNFENRYKFKGSTAADAQPDYMGAKIDFHKDIEEILEHYFTYNEISGSLIDPNKPAKTKAAFGKAAPTASDTQETDGSTEPNETTQIQNKPTTYAPQIQPHNDVFMVACQPPVDNSDAIENPIIENTDAEYIDIESRSAEYTDTESTDTSNPEKTKKGMPADFLKKEKASIDKDPARKGLNKTLLIVFIVILMLVILGIIFGIIMSGHTSLPKDTEKTTEQITEENTTEQVKTLNIVEYVGYWGNAWSGDYELTIHNANNDYVYFSYWLYGRKPIDNVAAQLNDDTAFFSVADDGAFIKGFLTFEGNNIILEITESTSDFVFVDSIEFSVHRMYSEEYTNEEAETEIETEIETETETRPNLHETPYLISVESDYNVIYSEASYNSNFVQYLPAGTYTIVSEKYDENNNVWGELLSGIGWICISDVLYNGYILDAQISQNVNDN